MPAPLDEFPIHQVALSMAEVGTTDRNFYDRSYFNAHDRSGEVMVVTGLGVYPNLGVADAYAVVRLGSRQHAVRCSGPIFENRLDQRVGPYRIEVLEPLRRVRLVCDALDHGIGFDLEWEGSHPAVDEQRHELRGAHRIVVHSHRFAQVGTWAGVLRVDGREFVLDRSRWVGTRDRSWGIRPVGEPEPPGRPADGPVGLFWVYAPLRFEDFALLFIAQELPDGTRTLNEASRVWTDGRVEHLGWPRLDVRYRSGTRIPTGAVVTAGVPGREPLRVEIETRGFVALHVGAGYGADPDWSHGTWRGEGWLEGRTYDLEEPDVARRVPFGVLDHVAVARCGDLEGAGLFEHACVGRHDPSGFSGVEDVAP